MIILISFVVGSVLFFSCQESNGLLDQSSYNLNIREGWKSPNIPSNNPLTVASVAFGKELFFDKRLSVDSTISCAGCHRPTSGFADATPKSVGVRGALGFRNSGPLANVAYLPYLNRDGGIKSLDVFSAVPLEDHDEMGFNLVLMTERLNQDESYFDKAQQIYGKEVNGFVVTRALASYLRTFISDSSPYDKFVYDKDSIAITSQQKKGYDLFFGEKAKCSKCHNGINLTNFEFENNGLLESYVNKDRGRERITLNPDDEGRFRVASLRNIALTKPYMHDGSLADLESVLEHYANHGKNHKNENPIIDQIQLSNEDQLDIISFLESLTDTSFINNRHFYPDN